MAVETHLDELIDYSSKIISALCASPDVVRLILDKADVNIYGADAEEARRYMYDYDYIDETVQKSGAFIMVDCDMVDSPSASFKEMEVYVQIVVSKTFMELDPAIFPGIRGNRRDNLARQIDLLINGRRDFGVGKLMLSSAKTAGVPSTFTSKMLTYSIPDFARNVRASK